MSVDKTNPSSTPQILNAVAREVKSLKATAAQPSGGSGIGSFAVSAVRGNFDQTLLDDIEQFARIVSNPAHAVGRMPPEPPTLRGRAGAAPIRFIKRCLFWYSEQINDLHGKIGELLRRIAVHVSHLAAESTRQRRLVEDMTIQAGLLDQATRTLRDDLGTVRHSLPADLEAGWRAALEIQRTALKQEFEAAIQAERLALRNDSEAKLAALREALRKAELLVHQTRAALSAQESRISLLMRRSPGPVGYVSAPPVPERAADISCDELGPLYLAFENVFRGTRADIKERVSEYLPLLTARQIGTAQMPVLDLGCGRGEWLEVLGEKGLTAVGVDSNETCARECHIRDLDVRVADAITFLSELPEQSQGAVTSFHMVEHMPFPAILNLLDEAVRVLKPGGLLILETPNPANLTVGATTFYMDPTHIRPIPADLLRFFVESRGFCDVEARPLHPFPASYRLNDEGNSAAALLNDMIYGPRDYAIVAQRP